MPPPCSGIKGGRGEKTPKPAHYGSASQRCISIAPLGTKAGRSPRSPPAAPWPGGRRWQPEPGMAMAAGPLPTSVPVPAVGCVPAGDPQAPGWMRSAEQPRRWKGEGLRCIPRERPRLAQRPSPAHVNAGAPPPSRRGEQLGRKMPPHWQRHGDPALCSPQDALTFRLEWSFLKAEDFKFPLNAAVF